MKTFQLNWPKLCVLMAMLMVTGQRLAAQPGGARGRGATSSPALPSASAALVAATEAKVAEVEKKIAEMKQHLTAAPPKREIQIADGPTAKVKLFLADPKLLENKVVATFYLLVDPVREGDDNLTDQGGANSRNFVRQFELRLADPQSRDFYRYPADLRELIHWESGLFIQPTVFDGRSRGVSNDYMRQTSKQFKQFVEHCEANERPAGAELAFFVSGECDDGLVERSVHRGSSGSGWRYRVFARSAEEARKRAETLLQLIDCGVQRPMQRFHLSRAEMRLAESKEKIQEVAKQAAALQKEEEKLSKPSEINDDILSQLKAQKVMVAVELAGLNARVKACDEMLKDLKKLEISALQSVSDMKVKAEIERVGLREKLEQINTYIGEGENRQSTQGTIDQLKTRFAEQMKIARGVLSQAEMMTNLYDLYATLPLQDDRITIFPVEWTN